MYWALQEGPCMVCSQVALTLTLETPLVWKRQLCAFFLKVKSGEKENRGELGRGHTACRGHCHVVSCTLILALQLLRRGAVPIFLRCKLSPRGV